MTGYPSSASWEVPSPATCCLVAPCYCCYLLPAPCSRLPATCYLPPATCDRPLTTSYTVATLHAGARLLDDGPRLRLVPSSGLTRRPPSAAAAPHCHSCHSHGPGRFPSSWAVASAPLKPPASPPVAAPRLRICAPTRVQVRVGALGQPHPGMDVLGPRPERGVCHAPHPHDRLCAQRVQHRAERRQGTTRAAGGWTGHRQDEHHPLGAREAGQLRPSPNPDPHPHPHPNPKGKLTPIADYSFS